MEEAKELCEANTQAEVIHEAADLLFFAMVAMRNADIDFSQVQHELDLRSLKITRRSETEDSK
ncbi:MAG: hypothetical protein CML59_03325, partial [Rhodobacteraceae bacterium]|nr:hypothetical protein [Paracoccaceae bacterium]